MSTLILAESKQALKWKKRCKNYWICTTISDSQSEETSESKLWGIIYSQPSNPFFIVSFTFYSCGPFSEPYERSASNFSLQYQPLSQIPRSGEKRKWSPTEETLWLIFLRKCIDQAPAVRRLGNAICWINLYLVDSVVCFTIIYQLDSDLYVG